MFGLGAGEIFLVFVVALVVFGPEKIPEIARWLGKTSADLRRMSDTVRREFYNGIYVPPPEPTVNETRATSLVVSPNATTGQSTANEPSGPSDSNKACPEAEMAESGERSTDTATSVEAQPQ